MQFSCKEKVGGSSPLAGLNMKKTESKDSELSIGMFKKIKSFIEDGKHPFLPQWRMRQIRYEQSILNSQLKREGKNPTKVHTARSDCSCGHIECQGVIIEVSSDHHVMMELWKK